MFDTQSVCILCIIGILSLSGIGLSDAAGIEKPSEPNCNKHNTFFKHNAIYTYDYTITTSNGFVGVSSSRSGAKLTCVVTLSVPKKCEIFMELSECGLAERQVGPDDVYTNLDNTQSFIDDLQRYSVYFQMNKGLILADSIVVDDDETLAVLNIKRGLLSALQFQILDADDYTDDVEETDIFGLCHTKYSFSEDTEQTIHTFRNLRDCQMSQVFLKQFNIPHEAVKPLLGGVLDGTISENIYPFVSEVTCDYRLNNQKRLASAECHQIQYFKPAAYKGDILATVMTNISQSLELSKVKKSKSDLDLTMDGKSIRDIRFTYSADLHEPSSATDIITYSAKLAKLFDEAQTSDDYAVLPSIFEELVNFVRQATTPTLQSVMSEIWEGTTKESQESTGGVFLDALKVCGTEACMLSFIESMAQGRVSTFNTNHFITSITKVEGISEKVLEQLHVYCKKSESSLCWLSLGTIFNHNYVEDEKEDSVLYQVQDEMSSRVINNCQHDTLINTERQLNTAIKLLNNIGVRQNLRYMKKRPDLKIAVELHKCLLNRIIPPSVKRSVLRSFSLVQEWRQYKDTPAGTVETLFNLVKDTREDVSVRTKAFSQLIKTPVKEDIRRIRDYVRDSNTKQMTAYMTSAIRSLLENDQPELAEVKASWWAVKDEQYFNTRPLSSESYLLHMSKSINIWQFFKLPITDILGGQLMLDLVYEPSSTMLTSLTVGINYYHSNQKHNLFEVSLNLHGFELLFNVLMKRIDMTPQDLLKLYQQLRARAMSDKPLEDEIHYAKFQKNIIQAVENILQTVNHPVELDFDFSVDVVQKGQEVMFMSLKEIMESIRQVKAKLPPNASIIQGYLQKLMAGIPFNPYRFTEMLKIDRNIPTCAGLPLNMTVSWSGKISSPASVQSNLAMVMAKKTEQLTIDVTHYINTAHALAGSMVVPFGNVYNSGLKSTMYIGHERGATLKVRYGYTDPMILVENPTKRKLEMELYPILQDKDNEDLFYARGSMTLIHGESDEVLQTDPTVQATVTRCLSDEYTMLLGRSLCLNFEYPNVATSKTHAYFPLSGPFDLRVRFSKADSVLSYTSAWEYAMEKETGKEGYTYNFNFEHFGKGDRLTRYIFMNCAFSQSDRRLSINSSFPEAGLSYEADYHMLKGDVDGGVIQEWIKYNKHVVTGYIAKYMRTSMQERSILMNYTAPNIGWELYLSRSGEQEFNVSYTYYCTIEHPILYMFHPIPLLAAENGDRTQFRLYFKQNEQPSQNPMEAETQRTVSVGIYDKQITLGTTISQQMMDSVSHGEIVLKDGENEQKFNVEGKRTMSMSTEGMEISLEVTATAENDDITLNAKTSVTTSPTGKYSLNGNVEYTNNQDENISRKKRSLKSIFKKFKELAKEAKDKIANVPNKLFGSNVEPAQINVQIPTDNGLSQQVTDDTPRPPSIWQLKHWNAHISVSAAVVPKFPPGVTPGSVPPSEMAVYGSMTAKHPWNGGTAEYIKNFELGFNKEMTSSNFKIWMTGDSTSAMSDKDGMPVFVDGENGVKKQGGFFIDRQRAKLFNYSMNYHSPDIDKEYSILFNWDAPGHHEPLVHVFSSFKSKSIPFFNHLYDEVFTYEMGHIVHNALFEHNMLNMSMQTDVNFGRDDLRIHQNGSVALQVAGMGGSIKFDNLVENYQLVSEITMGSMPGKKLIYTIQLAEKYFTISSAVKAAAGGDPVPLVSRRVELWGNSHFMITTEWTPAYEEAMGLQLKNAILSRSQTLNDIAVNIRNNLEKPPLTFPIWSLTPLDVIKKVFMKNIIDTMAASDNVINNLFPVAKRENNEHDAIATRTGAVMVAMKNAESLKVGTPMMVARKAAYLMLKSASNLLYMVNHLSSRDEKVQTILQERRHTFLMPTSFTFKSITDFPDIQEGKRHLSSGPFKVAGYYYELKVLEKAIAPPPLKVGSVYSNIRSSVMTLRTFDGKLYYIPAQTAQDCSYLLAADVRQKQWSIVYATNRVTFITASKTITLSGQDNSIFVDDCKLALGRYVDEDYGDIKLVRGDHVTTLDTSYGVKIISDNTEMIWTISLDPRYRNGTIGLLGNSDNDENSERLQNGDLATNEESLVSDYLLSGPASCQSPVSTQPQPDTSAPCHEADRKCDSLIRESLETQHPACYHYLGRRRWEACRECDIMENNPCFILKTLVDDCMQLGYINPGFDIHAICETEPRYVPNFMSGYLDVVFVVSLHNSIGGSLVQKLMVQLADMGVWRWFDYVRMGIVEFGGEGDKYEPNSILQTSHRFDKNYFAGAFDAQWDKLEQTEGSASSDGLAAIKTAASFPFCAPCHKMIVLFISQQQIQGSVPSVSLDELRSDLTDRGIILNVISDYAILAHRRVLGLTSDGEVIKKYGHVGTREFPEDNLASLVKSTNGALFDWQSFVKRRTSNLNGITNEFRAQVKARNAITCTKK